MSSLLVFNRAYRLERQSVMLAFSAGFGNYCPSNLLFGSYPHPPLISILYTRIQCVRGEVCGHRRGRGLWQMKHLPQRPFTRQFFQIATFGIVFYQSNLSTIIPPSVLSYPAKPCPALLPWLLSVLEPLLSTPYHQYQTKCDCVTHFYGLLSRGGE